jgi:hypothetical protein
MAREFARIWLDINSDDEFELLPFDAQGFYCRVILPLDQNYCGVADWRPKRLTTKAPDLPVQRILTAAAHLEEGRYCLFDLDTEEVLTRSYVRRDQLLRNPKYAAAVVKAYGDIASKTLRAAVVTEIRRVRDENPEYSSWGHTDVGPALSRIMAKPGADKVPYTNQIGDRFADDIAHWITNGIGDSQSVLITNVGAVPITNPVGNAETVPIPSTYTHTSTPTPLEGYVSREPHQSDDPSSSPPNPHCSDHMPDGADKACRRCEAARKARKQWDADRISSFWAEVRACDDCDDNGLRDAEPARGLTRCLNHDWGILDG